MIKISINKYLSLYIMQSVRDDDDEEEERHFSVGEQRFCIAG